MTLDAVRGLRLVRDRMRLYGWEVIEVPGWETRGQGTGPIIPAGAINHWTAGPRTGNAPSLNVVVNGRAGLRNALCHTYSDRAARLYLVAARVAWHAGAGSWPRLRGNADCLGHEPECAGPGDWRPGQLELMADLDRVQADVFGYPLDNVIDHFEWATPRGRKVDRHDVGGPAWRHRLTVTTSPSEEDPLAGYDQELAAIAAATRRTADDTAASRRLQEALVEGEVARARAQAGLPPSPPDDRRWAVRIATGATVNGEPATLDLVRRRLAEAAADR